MGDPAHPATAGRPEAHEGVPGLGNDESWVFWPGFATDEPVAAALGPQPAVIGAGVSGDGEGAPEFFAAS